MIVYLLYAVPVGLLWVAITGRVTPASFLVGYAFGFGILVALKPNRPRIHWSHLPDQAFALVVYILILFRDITLSGVDVAVRVLSPNMRLKPGVIEVDTQDEQQSALVAALSADVITLTPGELVIEVEDDHRMYVHCLDTDQSTARAEQQQAQRLGLFKRILGRAS